MDAIKLDRIYMCAFGKYKGHKILPKQVHPSQNPTLYTCEVFHNGKEIALFENEIMTVYEWDKSLGLFDPIKKER